MVKHSPKILASKKKSHHHHVDMHGTGQDDTEWHTSCDTRYLEFRPLVCWCVWTCMTQNKMGQHGAFQLLSMCVDNMCTGVHGTTWHWTRWDRLMHFNCYQCDKVLTKKTHCMLVYKTCMELDKMEQTGAHGRFQLLPVCM